MEPGKRAVKRTDIDSPPDSIDDEYPLEALADGQQKQPGKSGQGKPVDRDRHERDVPRYLHAVANTKEIAEQEE